jgi:hypothetical protein
MSAVILPVPIIPGKSQRTREVLAEAIGARGDQHNASRMRFTLDKEIVWLQQSPMGDMLNVYLEGPDAVGGNKQFVASKEPYDVWFKDVAKECTGIDYNQLPPGYPEQVFDWAASASAVHGRTPGCALTIPALPGKADAARKFGAAATGPRGAEQAASAARAGVDCTQAWHAPTPMGDFILIYLKTANPAKTFGVFSASKDPYDVWFKQQVLEITGIDFNTPPPALPEVVLNWQRK